jgi:hypothetical protein
MNFEVRRKRNTKLPARRVQRVAGLCGVSFTDVERKWSGFVAALFMGASLFCRVRKPRFEGKMSKTRWRA